MLCNSVKFHLNRSNSVEVHYRLTNAHYIDTYLYTAIYVYTKKQADIKTSYSNICYLVNSRSKKRSFEL